jgi:hypothetical protein
MSKKLLSLAVAAGALGVVLHPGCGSFGNSAGSPSSKPGVAQIGRTQVKTVGADLEGVVSYKFANANLGDEWLIISLAVGGLRGEAVEIRQEAISVRAPDGRSIALPTQEEFIEAYPEIQSTLRRAAIASEPLEATRGGRQPCELAFQRIPGAGSTQKSVWVTDRQLCVGMLSFPVRGGVQPGRWKLSIEFEESIFEIPFDIEATE